MNSYLGDKLLFFPATKRSIHPIGNTLKSFLYDSGTILELGSGSAEHAVQFQQLFPSSI